MKPAERPALLVVTSTFPRSVGDSHPPFVLELSRRLRDRFAVTVLAPRTPGAAAREIMDGIEVIRFGYFFRRWESLANQEGGILVGLRRAPWRLLLLPCFLIGQFFAVLRQLRRQPYGVIHAHWLVPQGLVCTLAKRLSGRSTPLVCTSHGGDLFALNDPLSRLLKRLAIRGASRITVVSHGMTPRLLELGGRPARTEVIPMGVDTRQRFVPDPAVPRADDRLLFVGRLVPKKGLDVLLRALPAVLASFPQARLEVIGAGPELPSLQALSHALGLGDKVRFHGGLHQAELPTAYRQATVFVAPFVATADGDQEGLGLVMAEAQACGCPVIASALPAVGDVIEDGRNGLLVPAGDAAALATALIGLLTDSPRRQQLADTARRDSIERFDWDTVASRYAQLLAEVARDTGP